MAATTPLRWSAPLGGGGRTPREWPGSPGASESTTVGGSSPGAWKSEVLPFEGHAQPELGEPRARTTSIVAWSSETDSTKPELPRRSASAAAAVVVSSPAASSEASSETGSPSASTSPGHARGLRESVAGLDAVRVEELIASGMSVNAPLRGGEGEPAFTTYLHMVSGLPPSAASVRVAETLLKSRANVNPRSSNGCTPLIRACMAKNVEVAKLLLAWRADVTVRNDSGMNCLQCSMVLDPPRHPPGEKPQEALKGVLMGEQVEAALNSSVIEDTTEASKRDGSASAALVRAILATGPSAAVDRMLGVAMRCSSRSSRRRPSGMRPSVSMHSTKSLVVQGSPSVQHVPSAANIVVSSVPTGTSSMAPTMSSSRLTFRRASNASNMTNGENGAWALGVGYSAPRTESRKPGASAGAMAEEPPLLTAVKLLNYEAATVLLEVARVEPKFLLEAVRGGSLPLVKALLDAEADPQAEDEDGESPLGTALKMNEDEHLLETLRMAAASRPVCVLEEELLERVVSRRTLGRREESVSSEEESGSLEGSRRQCSCRRLARRAMQRLGLLSSFDRLQMYLHPYAVALLALCAASCEHRYFQCVQFGLLLCGLSVTDMWTLMGHNSDETLDLLLWLILVGFVLEIIVQAAGRRRAYLMSFYFYMDVIGAASLVLDVSKIRRLTSGDGGDQVNENSVILRVARAARLGARAGRFTRLVKMLRFLPGFATRYDKRCTAKALTSLLVTKLSTIACCLTILLVIVLPIFELFRFPLQDWSLQMWTRQLAGIVATSGGVDGASAVQEVVDEFRRAFADKAYFPHSAKWVANGTEEVLFDTPGTLLARNSHRIVSGGVVVDFDFGGVHQAEAALSLATIYSTILAMLSFSLVISRSVTSIAMRPLEHKLQDVRRIGGAIYQHVESMSCARKERASQCTLSSDTMHGPQDFEPVEETQLLDKAVRKLIVLSKFFIKPAQPEDDEARMYLGEGRGSCACDAASGEISAGSLDDLAGKRIPRVETQMANDTLEKLLSWEFNALSLDRLGSVAMCVAVLQNAADQVCPEMGLGTVAAFVDAAASGYKTPAYHNFAHATDVTHIVYMLFHQLNSQRPFLSMLDELALLVSAVCHDIGHPGVNNDFLVKTSNDLAIRYNDSSPLENMHCARLFDLLGRPQTAVFGSLPREQYQEARATCVAAILHTDNAHHMAMVKELQLFAEVNDLILARAWDAYNTGAAQVQTDETDMSGLWPSKELHDAFREAETRTLLKNLILHFADINNTTRPYHICREWAILVLEEFFAQGDLESSHGLPVSPLNDRERTNRAFSQISFIDFFAAPFVFATVRICAPLGELADQLIENTRAWVEEWVAEGRLSGELHSVRVRMSRLDDRLTSLRPQVTARHSVNLYGL